MSRRKLSKIKKIDLKISSYIEFLKMKNQILKVEARRPASYDNLFGLKSMLEQNNVSDSVINANKPTRIPGNPGP